MSIEYNAIYGINFGESSGFGQKVPAYVRITETLLEKSPQDAFRSAMEVANRHADEYLSDPETEKTTVRLLSLCGPKGEVEFDRENAVAERSLWDHILAMK